MIGYNDWRDMTPNQRNEALHSLFKEVSLFEAGEMASNPGAFEEWVDGVQWATVPGGPLHTLLKKLQESEAGCDEAGVTKEQVDACLEYVRELHRFIGRAAHYFHGTYERVRAD